MSAPANSPLPEGYLLQNYRIERLLSRGGFSFVYLARDEHEEAYAIKEYMPNALVLRREGLAVTLEGAGEQEVQMFRQGLKCFFEEGRALARIDHPNVVRVDNFFRANETVYMVMKYMRGRTLQFHIQNHQQRFNDGFIRRIFLSLLNGLREVHAHKVVHLDIKPANVYINMDGTPVLLDFGAARQILSEQQNLRPLYTAGFAAPEQYHGMQNVGPWSDIYSVGATMYACVTGRAPQPADEREKEDKLQPLQKAWISRFSRDLLAIIDACLAMRSDDRPPSVFSLQKALSQVQEESPASNVIRNIQSRFEKAN